MLYRHGLNGLFAVLLGLLSHNAARADLIFVANASAGTIGEYTSTGAAVNPALISGLNFPVGIAVSGSDLFVSNSLGTIGAYTTAGATVKAALISGLSAPYSLAVVPTVPEPGSCILALFGLILTRFAVKKTKIKRHNDRGWAYQSDEKTDTNGPHLPGFLVGRPFAHFLGMGHRY